MLAARTFHPVLGINAIDQSPTPVLLSAGRGCEHVGADSPDDGGDEVVAVADSIAVV